jgi:hypothetical protein
MPNFNQSACPGGIYQPNIRYYFDIRARQCRAFIGCPNNNPTSWTNNFDSVQSCQQICGNAQVLRGNIVDGTSSTTPPGLVRRLKYHHHK